MRTENDNSTDLMMPVATQHFAWLIVLALTAVLFLHWLLNRNG